MDIRRLLLVPALLTAFACSEGGKYPLDPKPKPEPVQPDEPGPEEPDGPDEPDNPPVQYNVLEAFKEDFSGQLADIFSLDDGGVGFRAFPGFPSLTESGSTILMLRLNSAGDAGDGIKLQTKDYVHFGSFSARVRLPDITSVQSKLDARVEFGPEGFELGIDLSSPTVEGVNTASKFCIIGLDWSADKLVRWVKSNPSAEKKVADEVTENVPQEPLHLGLRYYHNLDQAPYYPYELEIDWIEYSPAE